MGVHRELLQLLADGHNDETISRRLFVSVRTTRRRIADYMAEVGAASRFQAGVIAARSGHLDPAPRDAADARSTRSTSGRSH